jgi:uncharacterized RDD family membrane protein YckC
MPPASPPPTAPQPAPYAAPYAAAPAAWQQSPGEIGPAPGVRFAPHAGRLIAYIVDGFLIGILITIVWVVLGVIGGGLIAADSVGAAGGVFTLAVVLSILIYLVYFPYFWARSGQTPGMRIFRLRVVRDADGGPISGGSAVLRLVGYWISAAVFYLGFIWILVDKRRRGWHDLLAGTCVIEQ